MLQASLRLINRINCKRQPNGTPVAPRAGAKPARHRESARQDHLFSSRAKIPKTTRRARRGTEILKGNLTGSRIAFDRILSHCGRRTLLYFSVAHFLTLSHHPPRPTFTRPRPRPIFPATTATYSTRVWGVILEQSARAIGSKPNCFPASLPISTATWHTCARSPYERRRFSRLHRKSPSGGKSKFQGLGFSFWDECKGRSRGAL